MPTGNDPKYVLKSSFLVSWKKKLIYKLHKSQCFLLALVPKTAWDASISTQDDAVKKKKKISYEFVSCSITHELLGWPTCSF